MMHNTWIWLTDKKIQFFILVVLVLTLVYTMTSDMVRAYLARKKIIFDHFDIRQNGVVAGVGSEVDIELINSTDRIIGIVDIGCKLFDGRLHSIKHPYHTSVDNLKERDGQVYSISLEGTKVNKSGVLYVFAKEVGGKNFRYYPNGKWKSRLKYFWMNYL